MSDLEKQRAQTDARRSVARRRTGSAVAEQAMMRHLGIELYREQHQTEHHQAEQHEDDADKPTDEKASGGSTDR